MFVKQKGLGRLPAERFPGREDEAIERPFHGAGRNGAAGKGPPGRRRERAPLPAPAAFARPAFPELLAPAGSAESYFAAVSAGADAVYLGLSRFSARERAENFTLDELCRILPHARGRGVRVYIAMNALVTEEELPEAISLLHRVAPLSPDAIIVADFGLLRIVREFFPRLAIHVSTQAGCASAAAAEGFSRMGARRVILERHLRFEEVCRIAQRAAVGVEIFVHGSMCYSYSGRCLFSSYLGGKSGNRGACVQPCRRLYGHSGGEGAVFSTRDLSLMERLPELVPLGLAGLKIEGRMRSAEYVAGVVGAYRAALDHIRAGRPQEGVAEGLRRLASVIGREETPGLVGGAAPGEVAAGGGSGSVGEPLGAVFEARDGWILLRPSRSGDPAARGFGGRDAAAGAVRRGDRLRVQFRSDGSGKGFTALDMRADARGLSVKVPFPVSAGDLVFRVGGGGRAAVTRAAQKELSAAPPGGVSFVVRAAKGSVSVDASYGDVRKSFVVRVAGAASPGRIPWPDDAVERLRAVYRFDLPLGGIRLEATAGEIRWGDVEEFFAKCARKFDKEFYLAGKELRLAILPTLRVTGNRPAGPPSVFFVGVRAEQVDALPRVPSIVPVVEFTKGLARNPSLLHRLSRERRCFFRLPAPLLESESAFWRRTVREAFEGGARNWVVSDVGHFALFPPPRARKEGTLASDHGLYALNTAALAELSRLGAGRMILPVEAPLPALAAVGKYLHGLGIACAYGAVALMISRLVPAGAAAGVVTSPRGERFVVEVDEKGSVLRPAVPFSASGFLHEIRAAGIADFFADLRDVPAGEIGELLDALLADRELPGTSPFNLLRGNF